jgi:hypothetical protein
MSPDAVAEALDDLRAAQDCLMARIRLARQQGFPLQDIATAAGVDRSTISHWLAGDWRPSVRYIPLDRAVS